ncbi:Fc receptor-like protein 4 [Oenanthe melanoleuca]|uniref:Fc receptor-like protein 4 n=1 Tax=Oenanthe melanoleuca TaxID=2939378 RepID=UPI0024C184EB|nr:Fc receptor-like protein 4 [Oenanthe melanoleuca]
MARDTGMAGKVALLLWEPLVLQVPARALLEGDTVTLRCRGWQDKPVTKVGFYKDERDLGESLGGTELSLSPLELHNSGRYRCGGLVASGMSLSAPVTVTVHELFTVPVLEGPPELTEGSPLNLSCLSTPSPLRPPAPLLYRFYRDGQSVGGPQGFPQLLVPAVGVSHSGNYSCEVRSEGGAVRKSSARLGVTVRRVPLSGVSLSVQPPGGQVALGDRLVLNCKVAVGTGPLSFSWHRGDMNAPMGTGPRLELQHVGYNDSGQYQCRVSDGDNVVESPAVNVTVLVPVTPQGNWNRAVAAGLGGSLLFLVLLVGGAVGWHQWNNMADRKEQERALPEPLAPPEEGEVLYTHVVSTKQTGVSPRATTLQDPQVTYAELAATHGRPRECGDIYGNVL